MAGLIHAFKVERSVRRLRAPLRTATGLLQQLPGVQVQVVCDDAKSGEGEAPLLDDAECSPVRTALDDAERWLRGVPPAEGRRLLAARGKVSAPAAWALDCALSELEMRDQGAPLAHRFLQSADTAPLPRLRTNALATAETPPALEAEVAALVARGEHTIKLKLGGASLQADLDRALAARRAAGPKVALRLDANGAWDEAEAGRRMTALAVVQPEYLEQPVAAQDVAALARLRRRARFPLAADEAARDPATAHKLLAAQAADVLVLKPARLGVAACTRELAEAAAAQGVAVVLSSLFDGAVSLWASLHLAAALRLPRAHGLATGALLDPPLDAPRAEAGFVTLAP